MLNDCLLQLSFIHSLTPSWCRTFVCSFKAQKGYRILRCTKAINSFWRGSGKLTVQWGHGGHWPIHDLLCPLRPEITGELASFPREESLSHSAVASTDQKVKTHDLSPLLMEGRKKWTNMLNRPDNMSVEWSLLLQERNVWIQYVYF